MLRVENLETYYDTSQALFGMSFEINSGEVITLLGRNGMGKTTTVNSLMGIIKPRSGSVMLDGMQVMGSKSFKMAQLGLGLVPEGRQIFPNLSVRENLIATASNHLAMSNPWTLDGIYNLFPELAERRTSMGNLLSGGEQQMLAVGRALMTNPKLLILDGNALSQIRDSGLSILVIDKNLNDLFKLADRHYIVEKGRAVWSGTSNELQKASDVQQKYLGV